jgi:hypothetical protein
MDPCGRPGSGSPVVLVRTILNVAPSRLQVLPEAGRGVAPRRMRSPSIAINTAFRRIRGLLRLAFVKPVMEFFSGSVYLGRCVFHFPCASSCVVKNSTHGAPFGPPYAAVVSISGFEMIVNRSIIR